MTCQFANMLKSHGVKKGDRVAIYMPMCPLGIASMLACARIGAVHSVVFTGFSSDALRERILDCMPHSPFIPSIRRLISLCLLHRQG